MVDVLLSLVALALFTPILATLWVLIRLESPGPGFFRQERVGLHKAQFTLYKLRSMHNRDGNKIDQVREGGLRDAVDPRVTRLGRFLRRSSLDELPQLINVLKGDMSLVGPRPLLPIQLKAVPGEFEERFRVRPGITGLAQVRGRQHLDWMDKLQADREYAQTVSVVLDLRIMLSTVAIVIRGSGVYYEESVNDWRTYLSEDASSDSH